MTTPQIKTKMSLRRQFWITSISKQLVIMLGDRSGSMDYENKILHAETAERELIKTIAKPENQDGFMISMIHFSGLSKVIFNPTPATKAVAKLKSTSNSDLGYDGTNIYAAFQSSIQILQPYLRKAKQDKYTHLRPVVCIFTDGGHNYASDPNSAADQIKSIADLVTIAFGSDADETSLKRWATSEQHFTKCTTGSDLRAFLARVGHTICQTRAAGINATQALTQITHQ